MFKKFAFLTTLLIILSQGTLMAAQLKDIKLQDTNIPVIFEKHKTLPIFNLQLIFQNSGYINDQKTPGLTSLTAKLLNEGTKKLGSVNFARELENKAISISTNSGFETFVIEVSCLKDQYKNALKLLKSLLDDPNFTKETLEKLKTLQLSKLQQKQDDFDYVASSNLNKLVYKNTPLQNSSLGTIESINKIKLKDIKENLKAILNLDNLLIAAGGDIIFSELKEDLKPILKTIKPNGKTNFEKIKISKTKDEKIDIKQTQQSYIYFASPFFIESNSKDRYKAKVASFILGGSGFGSRLMEEIRVKNGLAYSAYGYITNKKSHSHFTGYLQTKIENTNKAKKMVKNIVEEFVKNGVTKEELESAKKFLSGSEPLRSETFSQRLNRAFMLHYEGFEFDYPKKELEKIEKLTVEELNSFIKNHTEIKNLSFSIVTK